MASSLFQLGNFTLHSGSKSYYRINCDVLTDDDWSALARMVYERVDRFREVVGIPQGGLKLAEALKPYCAPILRYPILIVDDVLTTGNSMKELRKEIGTVCIGAVVFARGKCPSWITPVCIVASSKEEKK